MPGWAAVRQGAVWCAGALTKGDDYYSIISGLLDDLNRKRVEVLPLEYTDEDIVLLLYSRRVQVRRGM